MCRQAHCCRLSGLQTLSAISGVTVPGAYQHLGKESSVQALCAVTLHSDHGKWLVVQILHPYRGIYGVFVLKSRTERFRAGLVVAFIVLPALLGSNVEDDELAVVLGYLCLCILSVALRAMWALAHIW
jgi:hypothetical protein